MYLSILSVFGGIFAPLPVIKEALVLFSFKKKQAERAETNKLRQLYEPTVPRSPQKPGSSSQDQRSQGQEVEQQRVTRKRNSGFLGALMDNLVTPTKKFLFGSKNKE